MLLNLRWDMVAWIKMVPMEKKEKVTKLAYILKLVPTGVGVELNIGEKERTINGGLEGFSLSRWLCHLLRWKRLEKRLIWGEIHQGSVFFFSFFFLWNRLLSLNVLSITQVVMSVAGYHMSCYSDIRAKVMVGNNKFRHVLSLEG